METIIKILLLLSVSLLLGYSGGSEDGIYSSDSANNASSQLKLVRSSDVLEKQFKASLIKSYGTFNYFSRSEFFLASGDSSIVSAPAAVPYSTTTLQEGAVDESDRLKTDGKHLFVSSILTPGIKIFKADNGSASLVGELPIQTLNNNALLSGFYLRPEKKQLIALAGDGSFGANGSDLWFSADYGDDKVTELFTVDVSSPAAPELQNKLSLEGKLISSRRIGSTLYLATRHTAKIPGLIEYPGNYAEAIRNRYLIATSSLDDMLPKYQFNGEQGAIFNAENCFYTGQKDAEHKQQSVISLLAIDLDEAELMPRGQCFIGDAETVYASANAIYLATTQYQYTDQFSDLIYEGSPTTEIHKFSIDGIQTDYVGSASIEGHLGWQPSQKSFRLSEDKGILRVLSYVGETADSVDSPARLHVLQENPNDTSLDIIATLPNEIRKAPLGKKGEQIYATRFMGDRGYLVTFRATDPLYILNLSDPADPYIMSALEIDGYSDFLMPVGNNLLLGIGKDAIAQTDEDDFSGFRGAWDQGVKLSLIDISDPYAPKEKQKIILGKRGSETAVSSTHHALTTLLQGDSLQINLPVSLHETALDYGGADEHPSDQFGWTRDALHRYRINIKSGIISALSPIIAKFDEIPEDAKYYFDSGWRHDRSVIIGEDTYYLKRDEFFTSANN